jgi:hypothetical protein
MVAIVQFDHILPPYLDRIGRSDRFPVRLLHRTDRLSIGDGMNISVDTAQDLGAHSVVRIAWPGHGWLFANAFVIPAKP